MFTKILSVVCIICISVLIPGDGSVRAQDLVSAKVLSIEGQVEIRRQPSDQPQIQKIAFKVEDELKAGDTIVTGKSGKLVLGLSDGSQAVIAPKTTVVIKDLSQSPRTLFNVIRGKTRIHIEKLGGQPNPYRVNTPTAVIAVRGTIFDVLVEGNETQVFLHEGEVAVINQALPDRLVILSAGQTTRVLPQRPPNQPDSFKAGRNDGMFKPGRGEGTSQDSRRVADGGARPDSGRDSNQPNNGARPRGGASPSAGARPDAGRNSAPPAAARPNSNTGGSGRRP